MVLWLEGYPTKRYFDDFVDHFWTLIPSLFHTGISEKELAQEILNKAQIDDYQIGLTKVFLRSGGMAALDKIRTELLNKAAITIQANVRKWREQRKYRRIQSAVLVVQVGLKLLIADGTGATNLLYFSLQRICLSTCLDIDVSPLLGSLNPDA